MCDPEDVPVPLSRGPFFVCYENDKETKRSWHSVKGLIEIIENDSLTVGIAAYCWLMGRSWTGT